MHIRTYPYMSTWMCILIIAHHAQICMKHGGWLLHECITGYAWRLVATWVHYVICMKHEGWLLHEHIMPDTYKDGYLKRTNFQIWLHAYPGSYLDFWMYLGNTGPFPSCQLHIANAPLPYCEVHFISCGLPQWDFSCQQIKSLSGMPNAWIFSDLPKTQTAPDFSFFTGCLCSPHPPPFSFPPSFTPSLFKVFTGWLFGAWEESFQNWNIFQYFFNIMRANCKVLSSKFIFYSYLF